MSQSHLLGTHEYNSSASSGVALFNNHVGDCANEQIDVATCIEMKHVSK